MIVRIVRKMTIIILAPACLVVMSACGVAPARSDLTYHMNSMDSVRCINVSADKADSRQITVENCGKQTLVFTYERRSVTFEAGESKRLMLSADAKQLQASLSATDGTDLGDIVDFKIDH